MGTIDKRLIIPRLKRPETEPDELLRLKEPLFYGLDDLKKEGRDDEKLRWLVNYMFGTGQYQGMSIRWMNIYLAWPIYPNNKSRAKKPVGAPYNERIVRMFELLQQFLEHMDYFLHRILGKTYHHEEWEFLLEETLDAIYKAYQDPWDEVSDYYGLRRDCVIYRPDNTILDEIRGEILQIKKDLKEVPWQKQN